VSKDARRHDRVPFVGPVRLSWEDARGEARFAHAKCVDVSESGMRIESPTPIPNGARIQLNAERIKLSGTATVKHSIRYGSKYVLGVELAQIAGETTARCANPGHSADRRASFSLDK
jgi:hypothetical protein